MKLVLETEEMNTYLTASEIIDFNNKAIQALSQQFLQTTKSEIERVKAIYEFVRDRVSHSFDIQGKVVTCAASDVLKNQEGICFAKAHLLAALLRSVGIPSGFCYQRLVFDDTEPKYLTLHGLNAVYLASLQRWIRLDARGNKPGVTAEFDLDKETLAFPVRTELNEIDYVTIYPQPNANVVKILLISKTLEQLVSHLPKEL